MNNSFKAVNWTPNEVIGETKFDLMTDNAEYLFAKTPRALYTLPGGIRRDEGIKLCGGRVLIPKKRNSDKASENVFFGNFFSNRCDPLITTGIVSEGQTKIFCVISGIGKLQPDNRGFTTFVNIAAEGKKNDKIAKSFYVTWQALGY